VRTQENFMTKRIMQKTISNLTPPQHGNRILCDREIPGFGVRITSAGAVSFILNYRFAGRERRYTIGRYPELTAIAARERAMQLRVGILDGHDPLEEREQTRIQPTVNDLASEYLERYAVTHKRPHSLRDDRQMLAGIIQPQLGTLRVEAVTRRDLGALHASLKATPYLGNRTLALLSKMFSLASEWGWCADNPARGIPRFLESKRERWLQPEELQRFVEALNTYHNQNVADCFRLLLLTGSRKSEVLTAEWPMFDFQHGLWIKPSSHTKEKKTEHIPLSAAALELLSKMKDQNGAELFKSWRANQRQPGPCFP
jgi:hypothetical protein